MDISPIKYFSRVIQVKVLKVDTISGAHANLRQFGVFVGGGGGEGLISSAMPINI